MLLTYIEHYDFISSIFTALKILCALPIRPSSSSSTPVTTDLTVTIVLCFPECHTVGIIQYISFTDKVLSLSNMHLSFLHVFPFFFALNNILLSGFAMVYQPNDYVFSQYVLYL